MPASVIVGILHQLNVLGVTRQRGRDIRPKRSFLLARRTSTAAEESQEAMQIEKTTVRWISWTSGGLMDIRILAGD